MIRRTAFIFKSNGLIRMMSSVESDIIVEEAGKKGIITLNRPKQLNALNGSMVDKIFPVIKKWENDENKHLIIVKSNIEKSFCAGGDVVVLAKDKSGVIGKNFFRREYLNNGLIASLKTPYVALIRGIVMGGGVGISIHGKYRVASSNSLFAMPETQIGLFPDVGVSHFLARMPNNLGPFLALTGFRLKGYDLIHTKIATHFVHQCLWDEFEKELLKGDSKWKTEDLIWEYWTRSKCEFQNQEYPEFTLKPHLETIERCFAPKTVEEIFYRLQETNTPFTRELLNLLISYSPLSLKVTLKQIETAKTMNVFEVLNQDYRIAWRMTEGCDFFEGVRALLIDKDKKPAWTPPTLQEIDNQLIEPFFQPLSRADELDLPRKLALDG